MDYESVMAQLVTWAEQDVTVRALILAGSAAAGQRSPAEWCTDPGERVVVDAATVIG